MIEDQLELTYKVWLLPGKNGESAGESDCSGYEVSYTPSIDQIVVVYLFHEFDYLKVLVDRTKSIADISYDLGEGETGFAWIPLDDLDKLEDYSNPVVTRYKIKGDNFEIVLTDITDTLRPPSHQNEEINGVYCAVKFKQNGKGDINLDQGSVKFAHIVVKKYFKKLKTEAT